MALFDVLDETGVGGLPAQEFLGDTAPSRSPSVWIPPTAIVIDEVDLRNAPFTDGARGARHAALRRESEEIQATVMLPDNGKRDNW